MGYELCSSIIAFYGNSKDHGFSLAIIFPWPRTLNIALLGLVFIENKEMFQMEI